MNTELNQIINNTGLIHADKIVIDITADLLNNLTDKNQRKYHIDDKLPFIEICHNMEIFKAYIKRCIHHATNKNVDLNAIKIEYDYDNYDIYITYEKEEKNYVRI